MKDLSKIPTELLAAELERRYNSKDNSRLAKELDGAKNHKINENKIDQITISNCAIEYDRESGYKNNPNYIFGIIKNGKFKDFYYESGLDYDDWQYFIPSCFAECMESTYEFHPPKGYKATVEDAIKLLKKAGYTKFEDVTGKYR